MSRLACRVIARMPVSSPFYLFSRGGSHMICNDKPKENFHFHNETVFTERKNCVLAHDEFLAPRVLVSCLEKTGRQDYNSQPIRVRHLTMARFQNKNKRPQRISDENGPLNKHIAKTNKQRRRAGNNCAIVSRSGYI